MPVWESLEHVQATVLLHHMLFLLPHFTTQMTLVLRQQWDMVRGITVSEHFPPPLSLSTI